jgi:hypothetical protein
MTPDSSRTDQQFKMLQHYLTEFERSDEIIASRFEDYERRLSLTSTILPPRLKSTKSFHALLHTRIMALARPERAASSAPNGLARLYLENEIQSDFEMPWRLSFSIERVGRFLSLPLHISHHPELHTTLGSFNPARGQAPDSDLVVLLLKRIYPSGGTGASDVNSGLGLDLLDRLINLLALQKYRQKASPAGSAEPYRFEDAFVPQRLVEEVVKFLEFEPH